MDSFSRKSLGFMLVLCITVSSYLAIVQVVNCLEPAQIVKTLDVRSLRGSSARGEYVVGDVLVIEAEHDVADTYVVEIRCGSSVVYEQQGAVGKFRTKASVYLDPAVFKAGHCYLLVFRICSCNRPVPGAFFNDLMSSAFTLTIAETKLVLDAAYNGTERSLCLRANLTDETESPVIGEPISFAVRRSPGRGATEGWLPLRSVQTDTSGVASLQCAFCLPDGNYSVRALYNGTENFGVSEKVKTVEVIANASCVGRGFDSNLFSECGFVSFFGDLDIDVSSFTPYAGLPMILNVSFAINVSLGESLWMDFYLDNVSETSCFGSVEAWCRLVGGTYVYECFLVWEPDVVGFHSVIVTALDIGASGSVDLWIQPCPSNLVLYCPEAAYGSILPVAVAFSKARIYEPVETDFFSTCVLAPRVDYASVRYAIDEPVNDTSVELFVNGTRMNPVVTDQDGLAFWSLNFTNPYTALNLTASVEAELYAQSSVTVVKNFTRISVFEDEAAEDLFKFNCSWSRADGSGSLCYGDEAYMKVEARLSSRVVYGVPVSIICAKCLTYMKTRVTEYESLPDGVDYLRVLDFVYTEPCLIADVTYDGCVGIDDIFRVAGAFGTGPGMSGWSEDCDLNHDAYVGVDDIFIAASYFGLESEYTHPHYYSNGEACVIFNTGETLSLDTKGCIRIPSGVTSFAFLWHGIRAGAVFEFYHIMFEHAGITNNVGIMATSWVPPEGQHYLVQAKLPSNFAVSTSDPLGLASTRARLNFLSFMFVDRKPVNLTVNVPSEFHVEALETVADSYVASNNPEANFGSETALKFGLWDNNERISYLRFNVSSVPQEAHILAARLNLFVDHLSDDWVHPYEIHRVTSPWDELGVKWSNQPSLSSDYSIFGFVWMQKWWLIDVTEYVRLWHGGSASNYGLAVKRHEDVALSTVLSREALYCRPALEVSYLLPSPVIGVNTFGIDFGKPLDALPVTIYANGSTVGNYITNASGVVEASDWHPSLNNVFNVTVSFAGNVTHDRGLVTEFFDFRLPTNITLPEGNNVTVAVGYPRRYNFTLASSALFGLWNKQVKLCINGTLTDGSVYRNFTEGMTLGDGVFSFVWRAPADGLYCFRGTFDGESGYLPCEAYVVVIATVTPFAVSFDVSPKEFEIGTDLQFNATVVDPATSSRVCDYDFTIEFFDVMSSGASCSLGQFGTGFTGEVVRNFTYPNDSVAHAYVARIVSVYQAGKLPQGMISSPIQLTVARTTVLLLNVSRDNATSEVAVEGWLKWGDSDVSWKTVKIKVNETEYSRTTDVSGHFVLNNIDLKAVDNKPTDYVISATFEGDSAINVTAWADALDGTSYPACTTIQFNHRPSVNQATVTVEPRATQVTAQNLTASESSAQVKAPKTAGQMKQEAQSKGLQVWGPDSFSWWIPFFKLHARVAIDWLEMDVHSWIGLFSCGIDSLAGIGRLMQKPFMESPEFTFDVIRSAFISAMTVGVTLFVTSLIAATFTSFTPTYGLTLLAYTLVGTGLLLGFYSLLDAQLARAMLFGIGATLFSLVIGAYMPAWLGPLTGSAKSLAYFISTELSGSDPVRSAVKSLINPLMNSCLYMTSVTGYVAFRVNPLMNLFAVVTLGLAVLALYLGYIKT